MIIGPPAILEKIQIGGVMLSETTCIRFVSTAKNLGITMDSALTWYTWFSFISPTSAKNEEKDLLNTQKDKKDQVSTH